MKKQYSHTSFDFAYHVFAYHLYKTNVALTVKQINAFEFADYNTKLIGRNIVFTNLTKLLYNILYQL